MFHERVQTAVIDDEALPWIPFAPHSNDVFLKYFKLDPVRGEMIVLMKVPAGLELPRHHHSGTVIVYTIEGRWKYKEHDWIAGPGSVVYETAASSHTPEAVSKDGQVLVFTIVVGDLILLDKEGQVLAIENWKTGLQRYLGFCGHAGITPRDLTAFG
jgi:quercetin dioxygenase-like cupin family protein